MGPAGYGSASGAIKELVSIGAVEGVHYRMSAEGEDIKDFVLAIDTGPAVVLMQGGFDIIATPEFSKFAVLNAAGMELVGGNLTARKMRAGTLPGEAVYVLAVD